MKRQELEAALERHHGECFGWALGCCGHDHEQAEDVLQSSYLKVLDGKATFAGRSHVRTWLFGVIWRTAQEHRRRRALGRWLGLQRLIGTPAERDPAPNPGEAFRRSESNRRLLEALRQLSPRQRDILHLVFYQELSIREAADVLRISLGSARTHYERGKGRLRELLRLEGTA
ncbi:MAG: RNA polymerase sigma factor [Candidatus Krumholzibacteriia bacterium]